MFHVACTAGSDHRNTHSARNRTRQFDIVTGARAVAIHARQEYLARAESFDRDGPFERVAFNPATPAMRVNVPTPLIASARINRNDDALTAKRLGTGADQPRIFQCGSVERDLVSPCAQDRADIFDRAQATAYG